MANQVLQFSQLPYTRSKNVENTIFRIHYFEKNPKHGKSFGYHAVESEKFVNAYIQGLQEAYQYLIDIQKRNIPDQWHQNKINVYIAAAPYFTGEIASSGLIEVEEMRPYIILPSYWIINSIDRALDKAKATAIHEVVHVFNWYYISKCDVNNPRGISPINEMDAMLVEMTLAHSGVESYMTYALRFVESPNLSLVNSLYSGFVWAKYLQYKYKEKTEGFLFVEYWKLLEQEENCYVHGFELFCQHIESVLEKPVCHPLKEDLFTDYCIESYLMLLERNLIWFPNFIYIQKRFGGRRIHESWDVAKIKLLEKQTFTIEGMLNILSCHYYRICEIRNNVNSEEKISITLNNWEGKTYRLSIILLNENYENYADPIIYKPFPEEDGIITKIELSHDQLSYIDEIIIIVSNNDNRRNGKFQDGTEKYVVNINLS